jgi:RNA polymerase primary sigma factor
MFIPRNVKTRKTNTLDPRHVPDIVSARLDSPACEVLTAAEELTLATRIVTQRADLWESLATFATSLRCALSSAVVAWATANDTDDEALLALASCARSIGGEYGGAEVAVRAANLKRSKERLAEHNLRLVVHCARRQGLATGFIMPMSDMINEGALGLMKAVARFDPSRGFRFSTMASWWIDHHISRAIADKARTIRLPNHIAEGKSKVTKAVAALARAGIVAPTPTMIARECARRSLTAAAEKAGNPPPTAEQIEQAMVGSRHNAEAHNAMTPRRVASIISAMGVTTISASTPVHGGKDSDGDSDQREVLDFFQSGAEPPDAYLLADERAAILDAALAGLKPATATILRRRFGIGDDAPMTLTQIGSDPVLDLGVSRERIRQVQNKGLAAARACLDRLDIGAVDVAWA